MSLKKFTHFEQQQKKSAGKFVKQTRAYDEKLA